MSASRQTIREWLEKGKSMGATHVVIALDTYDYDNYPVYVKPGGKSAQEEADRVNAGSMQSVDEVYDLSMDIDEQMSLPRVWNT